MYDELDSWPGGQFLPGRGQDPSCSLKGRRSASVLVCRQGRPRGPRTDRELALRKTGLATSLGQQLCGANGGLPRCI
jgi:hypothetical protein